MISEALLHIGLLIVVAKLAEGVLYRFGLVSIVAYTLAGVLLGPVAGIVEPTGDIQLFLSIGIFVLFFLIGLDELDLPGFMATVGGRYFVVGVLSVVIPILVSLIVTSDLLPVDFALRLPFDKALCLAGILSLSSLGVVAKVLADKGLLKELIGLRIFTVVIIAEVSSLLVVGVTIGEHEHGLGGAGLFVLLPAIVGFAVITWFISAKLLPQAIALLERLLNVPELSFGLLLGGLFLVVVGAEEIGLHGSLGALLFGASLAGLPNRMRRDIMPGMRSIAEGLFVPLFFASAGLHLDFSFASLSAMTIAALVLIPMLGKLAGAFIGIYVARLDTPLVPDLGADGQRRGRNRPPHRLVRNRRDWSRRLLAAGAHHARLHSADAPGHRPGYQPRRDVGPARASGRRAACLRPPCAGRRRGGGRHGPHARPIPIRGCRCRVSPTAGRCRISTIIWSWTTAFP